MAWISLMYTAPNGGKLYQSSMISHWAELEAIKPDLIVDLAGIDAAIPQTIQQFLYSFWPIEDGPLPVDLRTLKDLAQLGARYIREGRTVLSHCTAGVNRSSLLSGCILFLLGIAKQQQLVDLIQQARPGTLTNTSFRNFLLGVPDTYNLTMYLRALSGEL